MTVTNDIEEDIDVLDGVEMYRITPIDRIDPFLMTRREQLRPVDVRLEHRWAHGRTRRAAETASFRTRPMIASITSAAASGR